MLLISYLVARTEYSWPPIGLVIKMVSSISTHMMKWTRYMWNAKLQKARSKVSQTMIRDRITNDNFYRINVLLKPSVMSNSDNSNIFEHRLFFFSTHLRHAPSLQKIWIVFPRSLKHTTILSVTNSEHALFENSKMEVKRICCDAKSKNHVRPVSL